MGSLIDVFTVKSVQGMDFTTDKLRSLVRKWQTLIEAHVEVKTTDGYMLRMFCIGFTKKRAGQVHTSSLALFTPAIECVQSICPMVRLYASLQMQTGRHTQTIQCSLIALSMRLVCSSMYRYCVQA